MSLVVHNSRFEHLSDRSPAELEALVDVLQKLGKRLRNGPLKKVAKLIFPPHGLDVQSK